MGVGGGLPPCQLVDCVHTISTCFSTPEKYVKPFKMVNDGRLVRVEGTVFQGTNESGTNEPYFTSELRVAQIYGAIVTSQCLSRTTLVNLNSPDTFGTLLQSCPLELQKCLCSTTTESELHANIFDSDITLVSLILFQGQVYRRSVGSDRLLEDLFNDYIQTIRNAFGNHDIV